MKVLGALQPNKVFSFFEEICGIPHGSGNTDAIRAYCVEFAKQRGLDVTWDTYNNVLIRKPVTPGYENHPPVILQGHLDMVCEKDSETDINFETDGLTLQTDGAFVWAKGTTLGGDDGIAVAMAMAVLDSDNLCHPPLEVLFTTDEETGMDGAMGFDGSLLHSRILLNIDSENEGVLTAGCAGGARADIRLPMQKEPCEGTVWKVTVDGLIGGHSGVEINRGRKNADKMLAQFLSGLPFDYRLVDIAGGLKDNAIPVSAYAIVVTEGDMFPLAKEFERQERCETEPNITVTVTREAAGTEAFDGASSQRAIDLLCCLPNGVQKMSVDIPGLVQTSLNLGILACKGDGLSISFSVRSSLSTEKKELLDSLKQTAEDFGASYSVHGEYPAWEYRRQSPLRETMVNTYRTMYGKEPRIEVIHAGLECGLFSEKLPGLDAVSFGPDLFDIHTPRERMDVASVERTYCYLCGVLKVL